MSTLSAARLRLSVERPYLSAALWALVPIETQEIVTLAVDEWWRVYYNPDYCASLDVEQLAAVLYHEVLHLLREHHDRLRLCQRDLANLAADMEVNDDLADEGVDLPRDAIYPCTFNLPTGKSAEYYYSALRSAQQAMGSAYGDKDSHTEDTNGDTQQGVSGAGVSSSSDVWLSQPEALSERADGTTGNGTASVSKNAPAAQTTGRDGSSREGAQASAKRVPAPAAGRCGSCATGQKEDWELGSPSENNPGIDKSRGEVIRRAVAEEVAKAKGSVPAHLRRWADVVIAPPRVDWRRELAAVVRRSIAYRVGMSDYSYSRPSRRQQGDVIMPRLIERIPHVAVVLDTSGSMGDDELEEALGHVSSLLRTLGVPVSYYAVDADVQATKRICNVKRVELVGGGGTDMMRGIYAAASERPKPAVVIVITDGETDWSPVKPAGIDVCVLLTGAARGERVPSWARTVRKERVE